MAKKSMIERNKKRVTLYTKYEGTRKALLKQYRDIYKDGGDVAAQMWVHSYIQRLPRNSSKTRYRSRCWKTGRPRGYYRDFAASRHVLREMAHQCLLPGVTKSSW
jgi:small subunit ribosomal protein S14